MQAPAFYSAPWGLSNGKTSNVVSATVVGVAPSRRDAGLVTRRSRNLWHVQGNRIMMGSERRYMVYGIGNGIVDQQVKITDSELEDLRLSKGFMELADQAEQRRILAYLGNRESELHAGG